VLQGAKRSVRYPRYYAGLAAARRGFREYGDRYSNRYVFVAGLPKSGTSWIESMLAAYPGYALVAHPEITVFDYEHGGTHAYELPADFFSRLGEALCVLKIHCHGSANNRRVLSDSGVKLSYLYRDLRDAAVSHVFYVKRTPWHPEYAAYRDLDTREGLLHFSRTLLPEWRDWIWSWKAWQSADTTLELRYEDLLADTYGRLQQVARFYDLPLEPLSSIVDANSFDRMKGEGTFFRKGVRGDWENHFDTRVRDAFKAVVGADLVRWGYAEGTDW